jgi:tRNA-dihydrouridine synthase A
MARRINGVGGAGVVTAALDRRVSVAPMMDWTDRHDRYFLRLMSPHALLYTEMIPTGAILKGDRERFLAFDPREHPVALQLGGADPAALAVCARSGADRGYDEINLNVGCPSDRVQDGRFGACLMADPDLVARSVEAMRRVVDIPVTVKTRIGIDRSDESEILWRFVRTVAGAGCGTFIVHARKAWLDGLSPKENREIPPLRYEVVHELARDFPALEIVINGGIRTVAGIEAQLAEVDGVMIGREAYQNPYFLTEIEAHVFRGRDPPSEHEVVERFLPYVTDRLAEGVQLSRMTRHILGLFEGRRGARHWRRHLSEAGHGPGAGIEVIREAMSRVERQPVDA